MIYDIIGDIHGQGDKLIGLLQQLGYRHNGAYFQPPPNHRAIFVGDFIDRGLQELKTLETVFAMLDAGVADAVMGNHEYNAIAYATLNNTANDGSYLRPHKQTNINQHKEFLAEIPFGSAQHKYWLQRFYELPLWLETETACFVHACWDSESMQTLINNGCVDSTNCLTEFGIQATGQKHSSEYNALERVLKGIETPLPNDLYIVDKGGVKRRNVRVKWWLDNLENRSIAELARVPAKDRRMLENLPEDIKLEQLNFTLHTDKPIFVGHYWLTGIPEPVSDQVVCVDYSAAIASGYLTCYQFDTADKQPLPLLKSRFVQYLSK